MPDKTGDYSSREELIELLDKHSKDNGQWYVLPSWVYGTLREALEYAVWEEDD